MARQYQRLEFNSFIKGFVTEAGPLTFPENATIDEQNFVLNKDGSRYRRFGMNREPDGFSDVVLTGASLANTVYQTYVWENAGGFPDKSLLVAQVGRAIRFYDLSGDTISGSSIATFTAFAAEGARIGFASINGDLIAAINDAAIFIFKYNGTTITRTNDSLKIRDFFGVSDMYGDIDLRKDNGIGYRPADLTDAHFYNLRNQSFGIPRKGSTALVRDPIEHYKSETGLYPSNSDVVNSALYPDAENAENRLVERFFPEDLRDNPKGNYHAPNGALIIDALYRGNSRISALSALGVNYPELFFSSGTLPADITEGGATVVAEYAGRAFFAGFSDTITEPDEHSPRLSSYILFSQLVKNPSDIFKCYQEADPTSPLISDLLPTDGGFIKVENAYGINALEVIDNKLVIFAKNGVWTISGGSDYGFDATNYKVSKVTERGCINSNTIVNVDNTLLYWSESGIFAVAPDEFGTLKSQNITIATIQSFYDDIPYNSKISCTGIYDSYRRQARWLFNSGLQSSEPTRELVLDIGLGAFYKTNIRKASGNFPIPVAAFRTPPFKEGSSIEPVTVNGVQVVVNDEDVFVERRISEPATSEVKYLLADSVVDGQSFVSFGFYRDTSFRDWVGYSGAPNGVDADAYMITGWETLGDTQRDKVTTYINFHLNKSEIGFKDDGFGDFTPINPSSCIVQAQWEWTDSVNSNRWGRPFQAYRHTRYYIPTGLGDGFDNGNKVVTTKNKLRGSGIALSLKISTEPEKDCQLLGWSRLVAVETNV